MPSNKTARVMMSSEDLFLVYEGLVTLRKTGLDPYKDIAAAKCMKKLTKYMIDHGYGEQALAMNYERIQVSKSIVTPAQFELAAEDSSELNTRYIAPTELVNKAPVFITRKTEEQRMESLAAIVRIRELTKEEEDELNTLTNKLFGL